MTTSHHKPLSTKKTTTYGVENLGPGLGQTQKCGGIKSVNDIPTLPCVDWLSYDNTGGINKQ